MIKNLLVTILVCLLSIIVISAKAFKAKKQKVLVFFKTAGYHHGSIKAGTAAIFKMAAENNFIVDTTADSTKFTRKNLKQYAAVIFLNTTGNVLNEAQQSAFTKYIQSGKGFVGVHAAADTEYDWPWYGQLNGAHFKSHPKIQEATLTISDRSFIATKHLQQQWIHTDEWYNFRKVPANVNVLISVDEKSYTGGANGENHPISWYHSFDNGRAFYTALGHTDACYSDSLFLQHLYGGIQYSMSGKIN